MTSKDLSIFNSLRPFSIGFDDMFDQFENMLGNGGLTMQSNYPPYNIRKTGKDNYAIEVALAGFNKDDVEVEFEDNLLTVRTKQVNKSENKNEDGEVIHRGISQRQFARSFTIADDVKVNGAELKDGLLTIAIVKRPSFNSAPFTFTSSAIVNDLANCLCEMPLWITSPSSFLFSDLLTCLVRTVNKLSSNSTSTSSLLKPARATSIA